MSNQEPENNSRIKFIATTVETMRDRMATKADIANLESRLTAK